MAASTRSGLPGEFSGGGEPTDVRSARTLFGHDLHLDRERLEGPAANEVTEPPVPERPVTVEEEIAPPRPNLPSHTGKSRFPALARLFGRWNTYGQFEANRDTLDLDEIPRERFLRPLAIVVATAAISFFIVVALLKLRDSAGSPPPVSTAPVQVAPAITVPPPAPARPRPPSSAGDRPRPGGEASAQRSPSPVDLPRAAPGAGISRPATRLGAARRRARPAVPADPDSPMPLSF
jgi:hypothetical protein